MLKEKSFCACVCVSDVVTHRLLQRAVQPRGTCPRRVVLGSTGGNLKTFLWRCSLFFPCTGPPPSPCLPSPAPLHSAFSPFCPPAPLPPPFFSSYLCSSLFISFTSSPLPTSSCPPPAPSSPSPLISPPLLAPPSLPSPAPSTTPPLPPPSPLCFPLCSSAFSLFCPVLLPLLLHS